MYCPKAPYILLSVKKIQEAENDILLNSDSKDVIIKKGSTIVLNGIPFRIYILYTLSQIKLVLHPVMPFTVQIQ